MQHPVWHRPIRDGGNGSCGSWFLNVQASIVLVAGRPDLRSGSYFYRPRKYGHTSPQKGTGVRLVEADSRFPKLYIRMDMVQPRCECRDALLWVHGSLR